ncbi:nitrogen fixation protein FixH [Paracoccus sediminis]|uniref:Nitrogen fixation protein FixH n=1 Tax=Paracoccus sediminis TaxID=1214787 RepID=A0A238WWD6_9RHOB|nr:FixH family protein [Paracoccus sediminis]TBN50043.1 nitrogen fixation protein FixH [Paracoccus sediminis]SNR50534.1 Nitrogen fixation protein FixH [Paracoccus sediminis]
MARELTGRHVLIVTLAAFGVIIAVNGTMAVLAIGSFPGLEVANSYVASQRFDRDRRAQDALGWTARASHDGTNLMIEVLDGQGGHPILRDFAVTVGRPTHRRADVAPEFQEAGGIYRTPLVLEPGAWTIRVRATSQDGTLFRQRLDHRAEARGN